MILRNRVIWSDNGVLKDLSESLNNHVSGSSVIPFVAAEDYLYLGADAPFNHRWFEVKVVNAATAKISEIALWDGSEWKPVVEIIDDTLNSTGTVGFSKSGRIAWQPDRFKTGWARENTNENGITRIPGLGGVTIYDLYWARIKISADVTVGMELAYLGWKFANDEDLYSLWPEFDQTVAKNRFKSGITTWDQVHFEAAKQVIRDLKSQQVLDFEGQILEWEVLRVPAIHKAAEIIYSAYGSDFTVERQEARNRFKESMKVELFNIDRTQDADLNVKERSTRTGRMYR